MGIRLNPLLANAPKVVVGNAFSLNMLEGEATLEFRPTTAEFVAPFLREQGVISVVGHADTARLFSRLLGVEIPVNRATFTLQPGQPMLVGQYSGPRLPEGATELPEGATIKWWLVAVK
jgi:hypothetical protein